MAIFVETTCEHLAKILQALTKTPRAQHYIVALSPSADNLINDLMYSYIEVVLSHEADNWKHVSHDEGMIVRQSRPSYPYILVALSAEKIRYCGHIQRISTGFILSISCIFGDNARGDRYAPDL